MSAYLAVQGKLEAVEVLDASAHDLHNKTYSLLQVSYMH